MSTRPRLPCPATIRWPSAPEHLPPPAPATGHPTHSAIIYIRVSSTDQIAGTSLASQEADCRAWCERNGYTVIAVYRDEGETAKNIDRPGLIAAIDRCRKGDIVAFVCWKIDRLARNTGDGLAVRAKIRRHGTRTYSATENLSDDPMGEMVTTILLSVAQFDNEVRAVRAKRGMQETALAGGWCHKAPAGYILDNTGHLPVLRADPMTGPQIAGVFTDLAAGAIDRRIASARLVALGYCKQFAWYILRNPVYAGIVKSTLTGGRPVSAAFPGLVSRAEWERAQEVLAGPASKPRAVHRPEFPLVSVAVCGVCGRALKAAFCSGHKAKYGYYDCRAGHVRIRSERLDVYAHELLTMNYAAEAQQLRHSVLEEIETLTAECGRRRADATRRLAQAESRLSRLTNSHADGVIPADEYAAKAIEYRRDMGNARLDAGAAQGQIDYLLGNLDRLTSALSNPLTIWESLNVPGKKTMARVLFGHIEVLADGSCRTPEKDSVYAALDAISGVENRIGVPGRS